MRGWITSQFRSRACVFHNPKDHKDTKDPTFAALYTILVRRILGTFTDNLYCVLTFNRSSLSSGLPPTCLGCRRSGTLHKDSHRPRSRKCTFRTLPCCWLLTLFNCLLDKALHLGAKAAAYLHPLPGAYPQFSELPTVNSLVWLQHVVCVVVWLSLSGGVCLHTFLSHLCRARRAAWPLAAR